MLPAKWAAARSRVHEAKLGAEQETRVDREIWGSPEINQAETWCVCSKVRLGELNSISLELGLSAAKSDWGTAKTVHAT